MKKSPLGFVTFIMAMIICMGILSIWFVLHYQLIAYGKNLGSAVYEMASGSVLMLIPVVLFLSIIAFVKDGFIFKSYSFIALLLVLGAVAFYIF